MSGDTRDLLTAEAQADLKAAHGSGYAATVRILRFVLAFLVFAVVAAILLWPELERTAPQKIESTDQKVASNELVKPKFESVDGDAQPFSLQADRAVQDTNNPDLIDLEKPVGDITLKDGSVLKLAAEKGLYHQNGQVMDLSGDVRLNQNEGYEMRGERVTIDMKTQDVRSDVPVSGSGPFGSIVATGLTGNGQKGVMIFHGPATLILNEGIEP